MAGIYIHIPFCRQACNYCDFHFSTSLKNKSELLEALEKEAGLRAGYLGEEPIETIYFGGGTPSLLEPREMDRLWSAITTQFDIASDPEITLEANPDDLSSEKLKMLRDSPVNRLSIGVQSFYDDDLQFMNRIHTARESHACIEQAQKEGFDRLTVDLIYGLPQMSASRWKANLEIIRNLAINHLSAYALTIESKTALYHAIQKGKIQMPNEEIVAEQFRILMNWAEVFGYDHYEISNFAKGQNHSKHNSAYWRQKPYLGLGPSAHSFNGVERRWNVSNNRTYTEAIKKGSPQSERELLSLNDRFNEYIMTGLRTKWGVSSTYLNNAFGLNLCEFFKKEIGVFLDTGEIYYQNGHYCLTEKGKLVADKIASQLFAVE